MALRSPYQPRSHGIALPQRMSRMLRLPLCLLLTVFVSACGGGGTQSVSAPTPTPTTSSGLTSSTLCGKTESGTQNVSSTATVNALAYNYAWTCSGTSRTLAGNGVPNHDVTGGRFATPVAVQNIAATYTLNPVVGTAATPARLPGYAINSVKFDPGTAGTCADTSTSATAGCNYAGGGGAWSMVALGDPSVSPFKFEFGTDVSNAHVQPNGQYHYHGIPTGLVAKLNSNSAVSMTLVGWAADGFPIYANLGYSSANSAASALKEMTSSYRVKAVPDAGRPTASIFAMGHFEQDWVYAAGSGDLDECNGRTGITPEFPQGIYHYYITKTYPFIQRCVKGTT